jgi:hypothetical protein
LSVNSSKGAWKKISQRWKGWLHRPFPSSSKSHPTETVPDGPTADSGSRKWTQRFLNFGFLSACAIVEIAWLTVLAWATLSLTKDWPMQRIGFIVLPGFQNRSSGGARSHVRT